MKLAGIICGGFSSEFEISLASGATILEHFPSEYNAVRIVLDRTKAEVEWKGEVLPFDLTTMQFQADNHLYKVDFVIIYTHGDPGENGKLQAFLDMQNVKYINSGALASELSFDKWFCNQFLRGFDIPVAKSVLLLNENEANANSIINQLGLPLFVKPCDSGSSYGISLVDKEADLIPAIKTAFAEGDSVVIESFLDGEEVTCGVYRTKDGIEALPLVMIKTDNSFFDYEAKYLGKSQEICPAPISDENTLKVQETAKKVYQLLRLRSIARIDFMIVNGQPHVIEVNTTPGFTSESIVPKMIRTKGLTITDFWRSILEVEL